MLVGENEVQKHEPRAHEVERMPLAVAEAVFINLAINGPGEEMKNVAPAHIVPDRGMPSRNDLLRERRRTISVACARESAELSEGEVAGLNSHDVEKARFSFGVAEFLDPLDMILGKVHSDRISAVNSR